MKILINSFVIFHYQEKTIPVHLPYFNFRKRIYLFICHNFNLRKRIHLFICHISFSGNEYTISFAIFHLQEKNISIICHISFPGKKYISSFAIFHFQEKNISIHLPHFISRKTIYLFIYHISFLLRTLNPPSKDGFIDLVLWLDNYNKSFLQNSNHFPRNV